MIMVSMALSATLGFQKSEVTSPPAPSFKTFLATLPPELKFLEKWQPYKISELMVTRRGTGGKPVSKWFYEYQFMIGPYPNQETAIPRKWARQLKQNLTAAKGWRLEFPEEGTFNANAVRTLEPEAPDWSVQYRSWYGRSYFFIYNQAKPIRSE